MGAPLPGDGKAAAREGPPARLCPSAQTTRLSKRRQRGGTHLRSNSRPDKPWRRRAIACARRWTRQCRTCGHGPRLCGLNKPTCKIQQGEQMPGEIGKSTSHQNKILILDACPAVKQCYQVDQANRCDRCRDFSGLLCVNAAPFNIFVWKLSRTIKV